MDCRYLEEVYELYVLGALDAQDRAEVEAHLARGCPACVARLREAALTVYLLCQTARACRPSPKEKAELLRLLRKK